jgi:hypothetical protein
MNTLDLARRYETLYVIIFSIVMCSASIFYSTIEPAKDWRFLIWPVIYAGIIYDIGYKNLYKIKRKKILFMMFFLIPFCISTGFAIYRLIIRLGWINGGEL